MKLLKKWFDRKPYVPAILQEVKPKVVDPDLDRLTKESGQRNEILAQQSRNMTASVVSLHDDLLKFLGQRA